MILNYDELDSANKADIAKLKSYFSIGDFQERKNFDIFDEAYTRIGSFFGSTNRTDFLTDETGNVRWLCMEIDGIDFAYKQNVDIDKVWAQAYYLLVNGYPYQMTKDEISYSEKINSKFLKSSYEMELIREHYTQGTETDHEVFMTAAKIVDDLQAGRTTKIIYEKVGKALSMLGYEVKRKYDKEKRNTVNGYFLKRLFC